MAPLHKKCKQCVVVMIRTCWVLKLQLLVAKTNHKNKRVAIILITLNKKHKGWITMMMITAKRLLNLQLLITITKHYATNKHIRMNKHIRIKHFLLVKRRPATKKGDHWWTYKISFTNTCKFVTANCIIHNHN